VEPLEAMHTVKFVVIFNGQELDLNCTFAELGILDDSKLLLNGVPGMVVARGKQVKFFKRYREIRQGDSWYVGRDRWDAIIFKPNRNIRVYGLGVYE
jgi:hypothetical protein